MRCSRVWKAKVPPSVRIFGYLLLKKKILRRDVLLRRRVQCDRQCVMCSTNSDETAVHLLFRCAYARRVWRTVDDKLGFQLLAWEVLRSLVPGITVTQSLDIKVPMHGLVDLEAAE